ncbi:putative inorganic pyrophosphatase [Pelagophyceae sp. CCMP2097]|nr:putative inorganic pyrophosphatase [Pelagophyceae sp. CCMP2097]
MLLMATFFGFGLRSCGAFASPLRTAARGGARMASTVVEGEVGTESYRQFFTDASGAKISPWHDISLAPAGAEKDVFNMLTEIPKYGLAKMEVDTKGASNPIMQDTKKGKLRFYHGPIFWNYGCLPQTWEDPNAEHPVLKCFGDNDPIDVVEIGSSALEAGSVTPVRALGVLAMIDDGELDWKVLAIALDDPLAKELFTVADVEAKCPGVVSGVREWFRWYKTPDGKPINAFGFDEEMLPKEKALEVIEETHAAWKGLRAGTIDAGKLWKGN